MKQGEVGQGNFSFYENDCDWDDEQVQETPDDNFRMALYRFSPAYHPKKKSFKHIVVINKSDMFSE
jgi:hypothetical protein